MPTSDPLQPPSAQAVNREEWFTRYEQRFIEVAHVTAEQANACAHAETFEMLSEGFEDDPEGAADEEMSYWEE